VLANRDYEIDSQLKIRLKKECFILTEEAASHLEIKQKTGMIHSFIDNCFTPRD